MTSPTPFQLLPRLSDAEFEALREDIRENGIRVPIDVDESGVILDGHHRSWIGAELGIEVPRRVVGGLDEQGKRNHARAVNAIRRHLSIEQRREQVAQMRSEGQSIRTISRTLGVPRSTVADDVSELSETGQLEQPERIQGADGKERPATYKTTERTSQSVTTEVQADPETGEVIEQEPVGVDGKEYRRPEPRAPQRRPLIDEVRKARDEIYSGLSRLQAVIADDRFNKNKADIEELVAPVIRLANEVLPDFE